MSSRSRGKSESPVFIFDLVCVLLLALWAIMRSLGAFSGAPAQGILGMVTILFVPGYALVSLLFPDTGWSDGFLDHSERDGIFARNEGGTERMSVSVVERVVLAVGLSVCLVPLVGLGLNYTPAGIRPNVLVGVTGVVSILLTVAAAVRRLRLQPGDRFDPRTVADELGTLSRNGTERSISPLNVLLILGLVIAASGAGFAAVSTERGEQFTEFYIVTENPETGEFAAGEYPDELGGEPEPVHVGVTNHEGETKEYTVVVLLQSFEGDRERSVQRERTLDTFSMTVQPGETRTERHELDTDVREDDLRVTYLLYAGTPPADERFGTDSAYRHTHFWVGDSPWDTD